QVRLERIDASIDAAVDVVDEVEARGGHERAHGPLEQQRAGQQPPTDEQDPELDAPPRHAVSLPQLPPQRDRPTRPKTPGVSRRPARSTQTRWRQSAPAGTRPPGSTRKPARSRSAACRLRSDGTPLMLSMRGRRKRRAERILASAATASPVAA